MKPMEKLLKRSDIIIVYYYFLITDKGLNFKNFVNLNISLNKEELLIDHDKIIWLNDFKKKEKKILGKIENNLKSGWDLSKIPIFEKALMATSLYKIEKVIIDKKEINNAYEIINQAVEFSKKYFDFENYKYINKVLDVITKKETSIES
jgi:transcription termination factor NusB